MYWCTQAFWIFLHQFMLRKTIFFEKIFVWLVLWQEKRQLQSRKQWQFITVLLNPRSIKPLIVRNCNANKNYIKRTMKSNIRKKAPKILLLCLATCAFNRPKWDTAQNCSGSQSNLIHCLIILSSKTSSIVSPVYNYSMHHVLSRGIFIIFSFFLHTSSQ